MNNIFNDLQNEFELSKSKFAEFLDYTSPLVSRKIISKGFLFNLRPLEKERGGFKKGKELKSMPKSLKDVYIYSFDKDERIILIETYGNSENIIDHEFCLYKGNQLKTFYYSSGGPELRNIRVSTFENDITQQSFNYGKYGLSMENFIYEDRELTAVKVEAKEHAKADWSKYVFNMVYGESKTLIKIQKSFENGYAKEVYPNMK